MATTRLRTWEITDEFWAKVETYIPNDLRCPGKLSPKTGRREKISLWKPIVFFGYRLCSPHGNYLECIAAQGI